MDAMNVIPDEDFDRLWDEAVAEAAVKSIKQLRSHSRSKGQRYAPSSKQQSNRRETIAVVHQRVEKSCGNELTRRRTSESIKNGLTRRPRSESNSHELPRQPRSESNEHGLTRRRSSESLRNELTRRRTSESNNGGLIRRRSSESNGHDLIRRRSSETNSNQELAHRSSSESSGQSRRRSSESSSGHELPHRRSTISKVPSLPRLTELTKDTMYGREDLSASSYSSGLNTASSNKYAMDDCSSVSSLASGFSGFESMSPIQHEQPQRSLASETRRKQLGETRSKSRSPTRDAKKQKNTGGGQKEVVNYILEADSSEQQQQLLFEIPTIFEVKGHKENRNQSTGLVLTFGRENDNGTVLVKGISPTSLFANTRLKSGHEILMINSHRVKSPQQAAKIMKSLSGDVTIYVSEGTRAPGLKYIRVKARSKKMMNGHTGESSLHSAAKDVTLVTRNDRLVRVAHVDPDGAFSKNLSAGDVVITVNGTLVQNDEEAMKLLDTTNHGVICMLIYSMANLWKGLIDQLLPGWKRCWVSEAEVTVSRDNISLSIVWRYDWACECNHSDEEAVDNSDVQSAIGKINVATSFVINSIIEASEVQRKQIALDADCITCTATTDQTTEESADNESDKAGHEPEESRDVTDPSIEEGSDNATTDPTTEESTDNESDKAGHEPEESPQVTDPSIEEGSDNGDVSGESGHAPAETLQESSKSKRPTMHKGISLYLELHGDDESSVEDC